ncbi:MAG: Smr/MutS family protein [Flavobacteriales bacterium]|nr:Smr/MutS family protein [Flavobacteriales bacterium]
MAARVYKCGDRVSFLNEVGGGVVLRALSHNRALVRTDDGFELEYPMALLVPRIEGPDHQVYGVSDHQAGLVAANDRLEEQRRRDRRRPLQARPGGKRAERADDSVMEVDLHLHELIDNERGMSDGEKLQYQLSYFERMLATAIRERKRRLIVIHGVGEGVLREEVRKVLQYYDHLRFDDADPRRYGYGATAVELFHH